MLEFPESHVLADQMKHILTGKTVSAVVAYHSPHKFAWLSGEPDSYPVRLNGKRVTGAAAFGGMAELTIGNMRLVFGDGTNVRYFAPGDKLPEKHQLLITFDDDSALTGSVQMYGALWLLGAEEDGGMYYNIAKESVSPLSDAFAEAHFMHLKEGLKETTSAKAFLATEQRIPGLGNGVLQDILWNARIHPKRKLLTISDDEMKTLYRSVRETLDEMTRMGGRNTEKDLFAQPGGYKTKFSSLTYGSACPACGESIAREAYLGGKVYYCPACQVI